MNGHKNKLQMKCDMTYLDDYRYKQNTYYRKTNKVIN